MTHGTRSCYVWHRCRCAACREANTTYTGTWAKRRRDRRRQLVPARDTRAMVREMQAAGISQARLAKMLGYRRPYLSFMARRQTLVTRDTEERVRFLYRYFLHKSLAG